MKTIVGWMVTACLILLLACSKTEPVGSENVLTVEGAFTAVNTAYYPDTQQYVRIHVSMPGPQIRYDYLRDIGQGNISSPVVCLVGAPYELSAEKRRALSDVLRPLITRNSLELRAAPLAFVSNNVTASGIPVSLIQVWTSRNSVLCADLSNNYFPRGEGGLDRLLKETGAPKEKEWGTIYWLLNSCLMDGVVRTELRDGSDFVQLRNLMRAGRSSDDAWRELYSKGVMGVAPDGVLTLLQSRSKLIENGKKEISATAYEEYQRGFSIFAKIYKR